MSSKEIILSLGGGSEKGPLKDNDSLYFNKRDHFLRSLFHQPNHSGHDPNLKAKLQEDWNRYHRPVFRARNQK